MGAMLSLAFLGLAGCADSLSVEAPFAVRELTPPLASANSASGCADAISGTDGNDTLLGTAGGDCIEGGAGDDLLIGDPVIPVNEIAVVYGQGATENGDIDLLLDIYQSGEPCTTYRPFVILIHGGGFTGGSRDSQTWQNFGEAVAARNLVGISIDYRLVGDEPIVSNAYIGLRDAIRDGLDGDPTEKQIEQGDAATAATEDTIKAINWVQTNGLDRCIDPHRFAIWGSSAGAILGVFTAYNVDDIGIASPSPDALINYWGQNLVEGGIIFNDAPLLIVHGTADTTAPYAEALSLQSEAETAMVPYSFYTVTGAGHGHGQIPASQTFFNGRSLQDITLDFIEAHVRPGGMPIYEVLEIQKP